jgi:glycerol uptake facilitator protein
MSNGDIHGEGRGRVVIGPSLGGPTGYAITPARELRPRPDRSHLWIPVVGPLIGGVLSGIVFKAAR